MSVDILGTSWDQCRSMVQYRFTSTETRRFVRTDSPGRPPRLSHSSWTMLLLGKNQSRMSRICRTGPERSAQLGKPSGCPARWRRRSCTSPAAWPSCRRRVKSNRPPPTLACKTCSPVQFSSVWFSSVQDSIDGSTRMEKPIRAVLHPVCRRRVKADWPPLMLTCETLGRHVLQFCSVQFSFVQFSSRWYW